MTYPIHVSSERITQVKSESWSGQRYLFRTTTPDVFLIKNWKESKETPGALTWFSYRWPAKMYFLLHLLRELHRRDWEKNSFQLSLFTHKRRHKNSETVMAYLRMICTCTPHNFFTYLLGREMDHKILQLDLAMSPEKKRKREK